MSTPAGDDSGPYLAARSKVFSARKNSRSMKGTIPSEVVEELQLRDGDLIEWELVREKGQALARVKRSVG